MAVGKVRASTSGDINKMKRDLKDSGGGDKWFYGLPADESIQVRFMVEPFEFTSYLNHFIDKNSQFPCNEGDCIGCDEGNDARKVWIAPLVDVNETRTRAMRIPKSIVDLLVKKYERKGTILDRDFTIYREGSTKDDTRYELEEEEKSRRKLNEYELPDIMGMLEAQLEEATDAVSDDEDDDDPPRRGRAAKKVSKKVSSNIASKKKRRPVDDDDDDEDDDDPGFSGRAAKSAKRSTGGARKVARPALKKKGLRR